MPLDDHRFDTAERDSVARRKSERPIPLLLMQGDGVSDDAIAALSQSPRVQLFRARDLQSSAAPFSVRVARATILATRRDPVDELVFHRTAGYSAELVFAVDAAYLGLRDQLRQAGALDCIALPISPQDLDRVLEMVESLPDPSVMHPPLGILLDPVERTVRRGDAVVRLSQREFALLDCLVRSGTRPVAVNEIREYVWGGQQHGTGTCEIVDVYVSQLRKKLRHVGLRDAIRTYRSFGYGLSDVSVSE